MRSAARTRWTAGAICLLGALSAMTWAEDRIPYLSGGVGQSSQEELKARQGEFSLKLVFAERKTGSYLANVGVRIADPQGQTLVDAVSEGPWFLAKLPAGTYQVEATFAGVAQTLGVEVPASGLRVEYLRWEPATGEAARQRPSGELPEEASHPSPAAEPQAPRP